MAISSNQITGEIHTYGNTTSSIFICFCESQFMSRTRIYANVKNATCSLHSLAMHNSFKHRNLFSLQVTNSAGKTSNVPLSEKHLMGKMLIISFPPTFELLPPWGTLLRCVSFNKLPSELYTVNIPSHGWSTPEVHVLKKLRSRAFCLELRH